MSLSAVATLLVILVIIAIVAVPLVFAIIFMILYSREKKKSRTSRKYLHFIEFLRTQQRISEEEYQKVVGPVTEKSPNANRSRSQPASTPPRTVSSLPAIPVPIAPTIPVNPNSELPSQTISVPTTKPVFLPPRAPVATVLEASSEQSPVTTVSEVSSAQAHVTSTRTDEELSGSNPRSREQIEPRKPVETNPKGMSVGLLNTLIIVGVCFVVLAGAVFATTTWSSLSSEGRTGIVFSLSILFFVASFVADRVLSIRKTAVAFHVMGSIFLPIAVLAVGFFRLLGEYLSFTGSGKYLLGLAGCLLSGGALLFGYLRYRYRVYAAIALFFLSGAVAFLAASFYLPLEYTTMFWYVYVVILAIWAKPFRGYLPKSQDRKDMDSILSVFSITHMSVIAVFGMFTGIGWIQGISAIVFATFFFCPLFRVRKDCPGAYLGVLVAITGVLRIAIVPDFPLCILLSGMPILPVIVAVFLPVFSSDLRKHLRNAAGIFSSLYLLVYLIMGVSGVAQSPVFFLGILFHLAILGAVHLKDRRTVFFSAVLSFGLLRFFYAAAFQLTDRFLIAAAIVSFLAIITFAVRFFFREKKISIFAANSASDVILVVEIFAAGFLSVFTERMIGTGYDVGILSIVVPMIIFFALCVVALFLTFRKDSTPNSAIWGGLAPGFLLLAELPLVMHVTEHTLVMQVILIFTWILFLAGAIARILFRTNTRMRPVFIGIRFFLGVSVFFGIISSFEAPRQDNFLAFSSIIPLFLAVEAWALLREGNRMPSYRAMFYTTSASVFGNLLMGTMIYQISPSVTDAVLLATLFSVILCIPVTLSFFRKVPLPQALAPLSRVASASIMILSTIFILCIGLESTIPLAYAILAIVFTSFSALMKIYDRKLFRYTGIIEPVLLFSLALILARAVPSQASKAVSVIAVTLLCLGFAALGRFIFPRYSRSTGDSVPSQDSTDYFTVSAFLGLLILLFQFESFAIFMTFFVAAILLLIQLGKPSGENAKDRILALAAGAFAFSLFVQPFGALPAPIAVKYYLFIVLAYLVFLRFITYQEKTKTTGLLLYITSCVTFFVLLMEALIGRNPGDALFIGVAAIVLVIVGFLTKWTRWFTLGVVSSALIVLNLTWSFWTSIAWWIYLLVAGILLISLAAANEWSRQRGESLLSRVLNALRDFYRS